VRGAWRPHIAHLCSSLLTKNNQVEQNQTNKLLLLSSYLKKSLLSSSSCSSIVNSNNFLLSIAASSSFAKSSIYVAAASSTTEHHLRGSGDVANLSVEETSSASVETEVRQLGGKGGGGKGKTAVTTTTTTTTTTTAAPLPPSGGGAEAPTGGGDGTTAPAVDAVCDPACVRGEVCALKSPGAEAKCYTLCSAFPSAQSCEGKDVCVYSTFECNGYAGVFNEYCECNGGTFEYCLNSECGIVANLFGGR